MTRYLVVGFLLLVAAYAYAAGEDGCADSATHSQDCSRCHVLTTQEAGRLMEGLGEIKAVRHAQVKGLYEVTVVNSGKQGIAYIDYSKKYIMSGPIFSAETKKPVNGAQAAASPAPLQRKIDINTLPVKNSIVMGNPDGKKRLFVFTDPDCPFCSKLHHELIKLIYMAPDLAIYVKMFPLKMHPAAYDKARVILGASDPVYMLNRAFAGEQLPAPGDKDSRGPVDETIKLAESLGINGTPALVLPDGRVMSGFKDAAQIKKLID